MLSPQNHVLHRGIVLHAEEGSCEVATLGGVIHARFAPHLPSPRTERFSPGHLVALVTAEDGGEVIVWRWFDAVVLGVEDEAVRLWEPEHGVIAATPRRREALYQLGTRAYLSAGLPGAEWWVEGAVVGSADDADTDLAEVHRFYDDNDLWGSTFTRESA